jgi:hypothetical protein
MDVITTALTVLGTGLMMWFFHQVAVKTTSSSERRLALAMVVLASVVCLASVGILLARLA